MKNIMTVLIITLAMLSWTVSAKHYDVKLLTTDDKGQNMVMSPGFFKNISR